MTVFIAIVVLIAGGYGYLRWSKARARAALLATSLSAHQRAIIAEYVPLTERLPAEYRGALEGKISLFLNQVDFFGCDGLDVTEEMELSIAAQACMLIVNSDAWYSHLYRILIYPGAFKSVTKDFDGYVVTEKETVRTGESWSRGPVILSWEDSVKGALNDRDGQNVVLHEFAHQLDDLSGHTDGGPLMQDGQHFADWERVFLHAYERHVENVQAGRRTVLDAYGAEKHAEFFAVAVEVFFEKPVALKEEEPEIYAQLVALLRLDPAEWDEV